MNWKIASRFTGILFMCSVALFLTARSSNHFSRSVYGTLFIGMGTVYMIVKTIAVRKKLGTNPVTRPVGIQKVAYNIIWTAITATILALILMIWGERKIGLPIINVSMIGIIVGFICFMAGPQMPSPVLGAATKIFRWVLCLSFIITFIGLIMCLDKFACARAFMYGGIVCLLSSCVIFLIYAKYVKHTQNNT